VERPFRLPTFAKWGALAVFVIWTVIYFYGGWNSPKIVVGPHQGPGLYLLGLLIVALYAPLYWWRAWQDRKLAAAAPAAALAAATGMGTAGASGANSAAWDTTDGLAEAEPAAEPPVTG
jgi:hypothetical protein